ncbi:glycosyltransferase family 39 protein [Haloarcula marina]|uniref:glycosyltransferase family 39 protein n=1 Tax=Haloarcula marina TaxID=2961574 RepID=UPI0020B6A230|nr:glycosyltransferase family 39 protein [Halomicroarcula marina]
MSVADRLLAGETVTVDELRTATWRAVFGDRVGVTVFLGTLAWVGLTWRLGFFSNDQYTFANALLAVVDGHLHIVDPVYGPPSGATPGAVLVDGRVYGRNYGVVLVSALWYVLLRPLAAVADVGVLLTGLWALAVVGVGRGVGRWHDRPRDGLLAGLTVGGTLFVASLFVATPLSTRWLPLVALQLTTALSAALLAVVCYRLVTRLYDRRIGTAAALTLVLASPVGFWATLPKRHTVTALFVAAAMYTLYRSHEASTRRTATRFRALTYVWVGLAAWVHAAEGFVLLLAVAAVDLPTARWNGPRDLGPVVAALALSLVPFVLTNVAISGDPLAPPRLLDAYTGDVLSGTGDGATTGGANGDSGGGTPVDTAGASGGDTTSGRGFRLPSLASLPAGRVLGQFTASYAALFDPVRLVRVFVRTGYVPALPPGKDAAINLSVLTSMPLLGALVGYPILAVRRRFGGVEWPHPRAWSPARVLDAFTVVYALGLLGLFFRALPTYHMLTVRYLHPLYVLGAYWLVRLPAVRGVVTENGRSLATAYAATVAVAVPAYLGAIAVGGLVLGEAVQLYALAALTASAGVVAWAAVTTVTGDYRRGGPFALGVAAGATTTYLLVAGLSLFPVTGEFLLPLSRLLGEHVHYARLLGSSPPA